MGAQVEDGDGAAVDVLGSSSLVGGCSSRRGVLMRPQAWYRDLVPGNEHELFTDVASLDPSSFGEFRPALVVVASTSDGGCASFAVDTARPEQPPAGAELGQLLETEGEGALRYSCDS